MKSKSRSIRKKSAAYQCKFCGTRSSMPQECCGKPMSRH